MFYIDCRPVGGLLFSSSCPFWVTDSQLTACISGKDWNHHNYSSAFPVIFIVWRESICQRLLRNAAGAWRLGHAMCERQQCVRGLIEDVITFYPKLQVTTGAIAWIYIYIYIWICINTQLPRMVHSYPHPPTHFARYASTTACLMSPADSLFVWWGRRHWLGI